MRMLHCSNYFFQMSINRDWYSCEFQPHRLPLVFRQSVLPQIKGFLLQPRRRCCGGLRGEGSNCFCFKLRDAAQQRNVLVVCGPRVPAVAHPGAVEAVALLRGALAAAEGRGAAVVVDVLVLAAAAQDPRTLRHQEIKVLALAAACPAGKRIQIRTFSI